MTTVLVVDDLNSIREFLNINLSSEPDIQIVDLAHDGEMAIAKAKEHQPDIILMDINMPGAIDGIEATEKIMRYFPQIKVLLLTSEDDREQLERSLKAGSRGYILKNTSIKDIASIIRLAEKGFYQIGPIIDKWEGALQHNIESVEEKLEQLDPSQKKEDSKAIESLLQQDYLTESGDVSPMNYALSNLSSELIEMQKTIKFQESTISKLSDRYSEVSQEIKTQHSRDSIPAVAASPRLNGYRYKKYQRRSRKQLNVLFISSFLLGILTVLLLIGVALVLSGIG